MQPRFVASREDGSEGTIEAVNAEPHDANIRGAICAERAAMCECPPTKKSAITKSFQPSMRSQDAESEGPVV